MPSSTTHDATDPSDPRDPAPSSRARLRGRTRSGDPRRRAEAEAAVEHAETERHKIAAQKIGNPSWFVPVMLGLMILGLVWVVTFYITQQEYPVPAWGQWNLGVGFALMMAGFAMTTRWK